MNLLLELLQLSEAPANPYYAVKRVGPKDFQVNKFDGGDVPSSQHEVTQRTKTLFFSTSPGFAKVQQEERSVRLVKRFLADREPKGVMYEVDGDNIKQLKGFR